MADVFYAGVDGCSRSQIIHIHIRHDHELSVGEGIRLACDIVAVYALPHACSAGHFKGFEKVVFDKIIPGGITNEGNDFSGGKECGIAITVMSPEGINRIYLAHIGDELFAAEVTTPVEHIALEGFETDAVTEKIAHTDICCSQGIFQGEILHPFGDLII